MVSAWCHERHHRVSAKQWPFRLAKLGDHRLPESTRLQEARILKGKEHCCVPWGMAKTLQHRQSAQSLASPIYCRFFYRVFSAFRGTIADLEARHARNQRNTPRGWVGSTSPVCIQTGNAKLLLKPHLLVAGDLEMTVALAHVRRSSMNLHSSTTSHEVSGTQ